MKSPPTLNIYIFFNHLPLQLNHHIQPPPNKRPPIQTYPKHQNFPGQSLTVGTSRKRSCPVRDHLP